MKFGKTIKIFLIDGDPNGRMTCELSNWTGKAYKIPRNKIKDCKDRPDIYNTGIYLLFGKNQDNKDSVYIGEAETVLNRLNQHLGQKDFWNEAIVFVSKDENLNKAHVKYLENRLHDIATNVKRYSIENSNIPTLSSISESDRAEMEEYIENIKLLVNTLGHKVFEEKREFNITQSQNIFYINAARGANASGEPNSDGFLVFKGSKASFDTTPSLSSSLTNLRKELIDKGILSVFPEYLLFNEDYIFTSASLAAATVMGRNANGLTEWKLKSGKTLKQYENPDSNVV